MNLENPIKKETLSNKQSQSINSSTTRITQFSIQKSNGNMSKRRQSKSSSSSVVPIKLKYSTSNLNKNSEYNNTKTSFAYMSNTINSVNSVNTVNSVNLNRQVNVLKPKESQFEKENFSLLHSENSKSQILNRQIPKSIDSNKRINQSSQFNPSGNTGNIGNSVNTQEMIMRIYMNFNKNTNKIPFLVLKDKEDKHLVKEKEKEKEKNEKGLNLFNKSSKNQERKSNFELMMKGSSQIRRSEIGKVCEERKKQKEKNHISSTSIIDNGTSLSKVYNVSSLKNNEKTISSSIMTVRNKDNSRQTEKREKNITTSNISYTSNISNVSNINTIVNSNSTTNKSKYTSFLKSNNFPTEKTETKQSITNIQVFKYTQYQQNQLTQLTQASKTPQINQNIYNIYNINIHNKDNKDNKKTDKPFKLTKNTSNTTKTNTSNDMSVYKNKSKASQSKSNLKLTITKKPSFQISQPATCVNFSKNKNIDLDLPDERKGKYKLSSKTNEKGDFPSKTSQSKSSLNILKVSSSVTDFEMRSVLVSNKTEVRIRLKEGSKDKDKDKDKQKKSLTGNSKALKVKSILDMKNSRNNVNYVNNMSRVVEGKDFPTKSFYLSKCTNSNTLFNFNLKGGLKKEKTGKEVVLSKENNKTRALEKSILSNSNNEYIGGMYGSYSLTEESKNHKMTMGSLRKKTVKRKKKEEVKQSFQLSSFDVLLFLEKSKAKSCLLGFLEIKDTFSLLLSSKIFYIELKSLFKREIIKKILLFNDEKRVFLWKNIFKYSNLNSQSQYKSLYSVYLSETLSEKEKYEEMSNEEKLKTRNKYQYLHQIEKDVVRTFPKDTTFKDKEITRLSNVLYAYAAYNKTIGYAQGMNYIIANALHLLKTEEEAFVFFDSLVNFLCLENIFSIKNENLEKILKEVENLTFKHVKKLVFYLKSLSLKPDFITTPWLLSLYSTFLEKGLLFKVWDLMIIYGWRFLINFTISVLSTYEDYICRLDSFLLSQEIKNLLKTDLFLQSFPRVVNKAFELESISL